MNKSSRCFTGMIGDFYSPVAFPAENYIMSKDNYDYEGNWLFCIFDEPFIKGMRIGYGAGQFDVRDYFPNANPPHPDFMHVHVEIITSDGAYQWVNSVDYKAGDLAFVPGTFRQSIVRDGREILGLSGWPEVNWNMSSDDGLASLQMVLMPTTVAVMPDNVMPSQIFSMFLAFCNIHGTIKLNDKMYEVSGTAFYDHSRIQLEQTDAPFYGMNFYTPMRLSDGSFLGAYFTTDSEGNSRDGYCFALYYSADGGGRYIRNHVMSDMLLDDDHLPKTWHSRLEDGDMTINLTGRTQPIGFNKSWGNPVSSSRSNNYNFPLMFDAVVEITVGGKTSTLSGIGLAEYIMGGHHIPQ